VLVSQDWTEPDNGSPPEIDTSKPHPARIYDYFLGGKDNFAADRETAMRSLEPRPGGPVPGRGSRHLPVS
jgi:S-adenosyl methyltransferase